MDENPYRSPANDDAELPEGGWYRSNSSALSYAELWRICERWPHFVVAASAKTLGINISGPIRVKALEPIVTLHEDQLGQDVLKRLQPLVTECFAHDFELAFYGTGELRGGEGFAAHLWKRDGTTFVVAISTTVRVKHLTRDSLCCALISYLDDETILTTANRRRMLDAPPNYNRCFLPGASVGDTVRRHQDRLAAAPRGVRRFEKGDVLRLANDNKRRTAEFRIRRGFWTPCLEAVGADGEWKAQ